MYPLLSISFATEMMWLNILLLIAGIIVVLWGADKLTEGAVGLAERIGIPQLVIGLTIVACGTSMPEFCVSLVSAVKQTPDLAIGNVVGSNIFNALLIVGCAALVAPIAITRTTVKRDIPFALVSSVVMLMLCLDGTISRWDALLFIAMFLLFMATTLREARSGSTEQAEGSQPSQQPMHPAKAMGLMLFGLACLVLGSNVFVDNASTVARTLGVSDAVIGLTIVAGGTSLPELATSIVAARKGNSGIAIGNVLGSNVFNILFILGLTGAICPMTLSGITSADLCMMVVSMILLWLFSYSKYTIERWEGAVLTLLFVGYTGWLICHA